MEKGLAEAITESLCEVGYDTNITCEEYSGRCMYGEKTWSVQGDFTLGMVIESMIHNADNFVDDGGYTKFDVDAIRHDSLGLGTVIY